MAKEKLVELHFNKDTNIGLYPSAEPASGEIWSGGKNVWFKETQIEHILGRSKQINLTGRQSQFMTQAFFGAKKYLFYENLGIINYWDGNQSSILGNLSGSGDYYLEPWVTANGVWLLATDNIGNLQLWNGTGTFVTIADAATQFSRCKIIKKLAQFAIAYSTNVLPAGFHWSGVNDPTVWSPSLTNAARNLNINDLDSDIIAVCDIGAGHAIYSRDTMLVLQFVGPTQWFGTPNQALRGIGAVGKASVVSVGRTNYGLSRAGIFGTDGTSFQYYDRPAMDRWLQENVDWSRASSISGYWNERLSLVIWSVPMLSGEWQNIGLDPYLRVVTRDAIYLSRKVMTFLDNNQIFGLEREVFDNPVVSLPDGIYLDSVAGTVAGDFSLASQLFDAGDQSIYKMWDYAVLPGSFDGSGTIQFGFTDTPDLSTVQWGSTAVLAPRVPFPDGPQESVFLAIRFSTKSTFKLSSLWVYGEPGGSVN